MSLPPPATATVTLNTRWLYKFRDFRPVSASYNDMTLKSGLGVVGKSLKWYHLKACVRFPIRIREGAYNSNYGPILCRFRDKTRYWSKNRDFFHTLCIRRHRIGGGGFQSDCHNLWWGKLEWWAIATWRWKSFIMFRPSDFAINTGVWWTDRQTSCDVIVCAVHSIGQ